ncbi:MAG: hypothetical protein NTX22_01820 [Ignavibacteriales bacterium]|nr:hypothetical protein [Ignavibacteriales bacterium]
MIILNHKYVILKEEIKQNKDILVEKRNIEEIEDKIKKILIGKTLDLNKFKKLNAMHNDNHEKLLILLKSSYCKPCYEQVINLYQNYIKNYRELTFGVLLQSKNERVSRNMLKNVNVSNIYLDKEFYFSNLLGIPDNISIVILLSRNNRCIFLYIVDDNYLQKDIAQSEILFNYYNLLNHKDI